MSTPEDLMRFISRSPSTFHACETVREALVAAGYSEFDEGKPWSPVAGGRYIVRRGARLIAAVKLGRGDLAEAGARILASHIDSPCLRLKPSMAKTAEKSTVLNVAIYGSPIVTTWVDRDLVVAGAVYVKDGGSVRRQLFRSEKPVCRISSLAPHLRDPVKEPNGALVSMESMVPIAGASDLTADIVERLFSDACGGEKPVGFDLCLADAQEPSLVGPDQDLISSPRLDNLMSAHSALQCLLSSKDDAPETQIALWYDSEEIGSQTMTGARSDFLATLLSRLVEKTSGPGAEAAAMARANSILLSIDMGHTENPAYPGRLDSEHMPRLNKGLAVKYPAQGNYAEEGSLMSWFEAACSARKVPLQRFMYKTGHRGGSSLGPIATTQSGIRGFDVGAALMGMHSIRELGGVHDVALTASALKVFLEAEAPPLG